MTTRRDGKNYAKSPTTMPQTIRLWPPSSTPMLTTSPSCTRHPPPLTATRWPMINPKTDEGRRTQTDETKNETTQARSPRGDPLPVVVAIPTGCDMA